MSELAVPVLAIAFALLGTLIVTVGNSANYRLKLMRWAVGILFMLMGAIELIVWLARRI
jgi:hypothetical protein